MLRPATEDDHDFLLRLFEESHGAMLPLDEPYWLGSYPIEALSLSSLKLIWAEKPGSKAEPGNPLRTEPVPIARKKHLTLYDGGRLD